jgi:hypothetical protein
VRSHRALWNLGGRRALLALGLLGGGGLGLVTLALRAVGRRRRLRRRRRRRRVDPRRRVCDERDVPVGARALPQEREDRAVELVELGGGVERGIECIVLRRGLRRLARLELALRRLLDALGVGLDRQRALGALGVDARELNGGDAVGVADEEVAEELDRVGRQLRHRLCDPVGERRAHRGLEVGRVEHHRQNTQEIVTGLCRLLKKVPFASNKIKSPYEISKILEDQSSVGVA